MHKSGHFFCSLYLKNEVSIPELVFFYGAVCDCGVTIFKNGMIL
jgi:hypothetical protein